jgi:hypothetical protein
MAPTELPALPMGIRFQFIQCHCWLPGCTHTTTTDSNTGINNRGQVIAVAIVPEPETYALILAGWLWLVLSQHLCDEQTTKKFRPVRL